MIFAGTCRGVVCARMVSRILFFSASSSAHAGLQPHEQHDAHVAVPVLPDGERFDDLVQALDGRVDLRGADAHAARIQHRVRAAIDDQAAVLGQLGVVAVTPDAGKRSK